MNEHRVTVAELGAFLAQQILEFSNGSTKTILEANQSKLKRLLGRF